MDNDLSIIIRAILEKASKNQILREINSIQNYINKTPLKFKINVDNDEFRNFSANMKQLATKLNIDFDRLSKKSVSTTFVDGVRKSRTEVEHLKNSVGDLIKVTNKYAEGKSTTTKIDAVNNYEKERAALKKLNDEQSKYWSQRVKETVAKMTQKPDELAKMAEYYKRMEIESLKLHEANKKREQSEQAYWSRRRKEAAESITQNNTVLQQMKQYYTQQEKIAQRNFNYGKVVQGVNASTFDSSDSFASYVKRQYGNSAELIGRFNDKVLRTGEIITQTNFRVKEGDDKWRTYQATLNRTTGEMRLLDRGLTDASNRQLSWNEAMKVAITRISQWGIATSLIYGSLRQFKEALVTLKEIDTELINIAKVTEYTSYEMQKLVDTAVNAGKEFGRTAQEYLQAVTEFSRAGFGKQAEEYGKLSLLLQNVGDINAQVANETLIAANAGFQLGGSYESLMGIIDKFNNVSNKNATTVTKLSEAMKVGASVFHSAGMNIDETVAIIGTATSATQRAGSEININVS